MSVSTNTHICMRVREWRLTEQSLERSRDSWEDVKRSTDDLSPMTGVSPWSWSCDVMAYFCTDRLNRAKHSRYWSASDIRLTWCTTLARLIRGKAIENDAHTNRDNPREHQRTSFHREGRSATDTMRVALARSRRRFAAKCAPYAIPTARDNLSISHASHHYFPCADKLSVACLLSSLSPTLCNLQFYNFAQLSFYEASRSVRLALKTTLTFLH